MSDLITSNDRFAANTGLSLHANAYGRKRPEAAFGQCSEQLLRIQIQPILKAWLRLKVNRVASC